jgi:nucleoside phosphorylase
MKSLYLFPTRFEAEPFAALRADADVVVIGVGMAQAGASAARAIVEHKPQRVVLCGIAGAFGEDVAIGEVVEVVSDRVAGLPATFDKVYAHEPTTTHRTVASLTVSRTGEGVAEADDASMIEQMEGAAVAAVCEAFSVEYLHLRAISNRVSDERRAWRTAEAIEALARAVAEQYDKEE